MITFIKAFKILGFCIFKQYSTVLLSKMVQLKSYFHGGVSVFRPLCFLLNRM